jgi:hypothetical protein
MNMTVASVSSAEVMRSPVPVLSLAPTQTARRLRAGLFASQWFIRAIAKPNGSRYTSGVRSGMVSASHRSSRIVRYKGGQEKPWKNIVLQC